MKHHRILTLAIAASAAFAVSSASCANPPDHSGNKHQIHAAHTPDHTCPPGLAKKSPPCVPPGHAKKGYDVGDIVNWDNIHIITQPGYYGLSSPPTGDRYAIMNGQLIRVNSQTGQILSILRVVDEILD